eukprot:TRINITY_DN9434_c0_g1_i1.p1 TRINITY_DN9434_c0_g1~~TRINITY_DN9434_c0_g1_i1.p1  ORF type:complete len:359 (-),score=142.55 TRINITY_DN9434_c0_g1_i1:133-1209(-)
MEAFLKTGKVGSGGSGGPAVKGKSGKKERKAGPVPWVEKYRPRSITDVAYQDEVVSVLKKALSGSDLPNLLFYGPPGTGKTSTILAAARDLFGDIYRDRILELNASDERGIQVVRDKVKKFAQLTASGKRPDGVPCPPYKIIILDEADSMTKDAQSALRRTMEKSGRSTKFCLICNYVSRIIEPITSRCAKFRFKPLAREILIKRLDLICEQEKVKVSEEGMEAIVLTSEGDLRKAITSLQSCARLKGDVEIAKDDVYEISGVIPEKYLEGLLEVCQLNSYDRVQGFVDDMICEGFSGHQLINQLHDHVVSNNCLTDSQKSAICEKLAVAEHCLLEGADEYLQIMSVATTIMKVLSQG